MIKLKNGFIFPEIISIAGVKIKISYKPFLDENSLGLFDSLHRTIQVCTNQSDKDIAETLFHELTHAYCSLLNIPMSHRNVYMIEDLFNMAFELGRVQKKVKKDEKKKNTSRK